MKITKCTSLLINSNFRIRPLFKLLSLSEGSLRMELSVLTPTLHVRGKQGEEPERRLE